MGRRRSSRTRGAASSSPSSLPSALSQTHLETQSSQEEEEEDEEQLNAPPSAFTVSNVNENNNRKSVSRPGIIYLSSIPPNFNVAQTTMFFAQFGKVGRVFLQPDTKDPKGRHGLNFTEGWVEFSSKSVAKSVANNLNNTPVGGKKRSKSYDALWNIRYLHRFKWIHLTERLQYERNAHNQRMRTEIARAKREADFFKNNVDVSKKAKKRISNEEDLENDDEGEPVNKKGKKMAVRKKKGVQQETRAYEFRQKETDEAIRAKKSKGSNSLSGDDDSSKDDEEDVSIKPNEPTKKVSMKTRRGGNSTKKKRKRTNDGRKGDSTLDEDERKRSRLLKMFTTTTMSSASSSLADI